MEVVRNLRRRKLRNLLTILALVMSDIRIATEDNVLPSEREPGWAEEVA